MLALDLVVLGRQLAKIGESVMRGSSRSPMPTGATLVLADVLAHPGSSINDITGRTVMPQSHVSEMVAQLVKQGRVESSPDPSDRRRTIVRASRSHLQDVAQAASVPVDAALLGALGDISHETAKEMIAVLEDLAGRLRPQQPGPIVDQLNQARAGLEQPAGD